MLYSLHCSSLYCFIILSFKMHCTFVSCQYMFYHDTRLLYTVLTMHAIVAPCITRSGLFLTTPDFVMSRYKSRIRLAGFHRLPVQQGKPQASSGLSHRPDCPIVHPALPLGLYIGCIVIHCILLILFYHFISVS